MTATRRDPTINPTTGDTGTNPDPPETSAAAAGDDGLLTRVALDALAPHPDNPRGDRLGDLTELVRSIKAQGCWNRSSSYPPTNRVCTGWWPGTVVWPPPAPPEWPVGGDPPAPPRRGGGEVPGRERPPRRPAPLGRGGGDRTAAGPGPRLTPSRLSRRIGRSQAWCRTRMALTVVPDGVRQALDAGELTVVPDGVRQALDAGELTVAAASAVASVADFGAEHMTALAASLAGRSWGDEQRMADHYRQQLQRDTAWRQRLDAARHGRHPVHDREPRGSARVDRLFDDATERAGHAGQDCHAVVIRPVSWGAGYDEYAVCTSPRRHQHHGPAAAPDWQQQPGCGTAFCPERDDQHARRQVARPAWPPGRNCSADPTAASKQPAWPRWRCSP